MDKSPVERQIPPETVEALRDVASLLLGWYAKFECNKNMMTSWGFLLRDLDSTVFIPAVEVWGKAHPDWPPTAPQFCQIVERLQQDREADELRRVNAHIVEISKAAVRRDTKAHDAVYNGENSVLA